MQVFYVSPWMSPEFIEAHGLEPRGAWFADEPNHLPPAAGACAFAQTLIRLAETHPNSAVVFPSHCDQLRRGFDAVARAAPGRVFLFNLPATWQTAVGERIFRAELERLGGFLVRLGGRPPSAVDLAITMGRYAVARCRLLEAAGRLPARSYCEALARFHWDGTLDVSQQGSAPQPGSIPLALVGGPLPPRQMHVLDVIERAGGRVVVDATETGERSLGPGQDADQGHAADETVPDLLQRLTHSCLERCVDVFQRPNTRLYLWLKQRLSTRQVRGILLWHFIGCDLWRAEAQPLQDAFGLPVLLLEAHEAPTDPLRRSGRIQAFLESLSSDASVKPRARTGAFAWPV